MAKSIKTVLIVAAVFIGVGLLAGGAAFLFSNPFNNNYTLELADFPADLSGIDADIKSGDVRIYRTSGDKIDVSYYDTEDKLFSLETVNGVLRISKKSEPFTSIFRILSFSFHEYDLEIGLPESYMGTLIVDTASGKISVEGISVPSLSASTGSGTVSVSSVSCEGDLELSTSSGRITVSSVSAGMLSAATGSGSVSLDDVKSLSDIYLATASGSVRCEDVACAGAYSVEVSSGSVRIEELEALSVNVKTVSGSVRAYELDARDITLKASSGSVYGSVVDERSNYTVVCNTGSGSSDLESGVYGKDKSLTVKTGSGSVRFSFGD